MVDPHLTVKGFNNLRVVDASIMPKIVGGNPHAATVMIAEKAAELIHQTWQYAVQDRQERSDATPGPTTDHRQEL